METIKYKGLEYKVTDRVESIITRLKIEEDALEILESKNYAEGKIPEYILILYLIDSGHKETRNGLMTLLTSEIFGKGLISYDVVSKFSESGFLSEIWTELDHKYSKGIVTDEMIKLICQLIEEDDEYLSNCDEIVANIVTLLSSKEYENGIISEETIRLMATKNELSEIKCEIISLIISHEKLKKNEIIKPILEVQNELICHIIHQIVKSDVIDDSEKENYILAMLIIENQENLLNVYNSYLKKKKVHSMRDFAKNFVLYTLPLLSSGLKGNYTRKKQLN